MKITIFATIVTAFIVIQCVTGNPLQKTWRSMKKGRTKNLQYKREETAGILNCQFSSKTTDTRDKRVLEDLYYSMGGSTWVKNTGWMKGDPCGDQWYGVCCSESGRVTELNLMSNLLIGQLSSRLAELSNLQVLRLYNNSIGGVLPSNLFTMQYLETLYLDKNQFNAGIPEKISMPHLTNLSMANNHLEGYLPTYWDTPELRYVTLPSNAFEGSLPSSIGILSKLQEFDLSDNVLSGSLPSEFGNLKSLEKLWLFDNRFDAAEIPNEWSGMIGLKNIRMDSLQGILPEWLGDGWVSLERLSITYGQIKGTLPTSLCRLKHINYIDLSANSIGGLIPDCICDLPADTMTDLDLSSNQFIGSIPDCFDRLHNLSNLDLGNNHLSGYLPQSVGSLKHLYSFSVSSNALYGSIPSAYSKLGTSLHEFDVNSNKLNSVDKGLQLFFEDFKDSGKYCSLYDNPWTCPLPSYVNAACFIQCSKCNTPDKHGSCKACVSDSQCGWCNEGHNCLLGSKEGPNPYYYTCQNSSWIYEFQARCEN